MKHAISVLLSVALVSAALPSAVFAEDLTEGTAAAGDETLSPEERARRVESLASSGADAYRSGDFEGAIRAFKEGYRLEPVPNLLYNIAKSYEKLEKYADAVDYYQRFVVAPEVDSSARQAALDRIESLREIAQLKSQQNESDAKGETGAPDKTTPVKPTEDEPSNVAAYATLGGSVALLGGGLALGYLASGEADTARDGATYEIRSDAQGSAKTYALIADGMFVAAAAAAGIGVYLLLSDSDSDTKAKADASAASRTVISPWVTTRSAGLGMSLDF
ncbi:tetratricopeptide repeat protein [Bradymonas sediminis]|uniref:tetratricopeptide repeat protein n=1 Tax=Bradymonas sediminis TaxID=1548548 RepID=UPI00106064D1|nr:hypothetical protein [Bradymonas sediminis]TDP71981.1 hypothetical protein DFR33_108195 [Bradymonas sediminis]